jgi:hypothetical protein
VGAHGSLGSIGIAGFNEMQDFSVIFVNVGPVTLFDLLASESGFEDIKERGSN